MRESKKNDKDIIRKSDKKIEKGQTDKQTEIITREREREREGEMESESER